MKKGLKTAYPVAAGEAGRMPPAHVAGAATFAAHRLPPPAGIAGPHLAAPSPDERLMERVFEACGADLALAAASSSVPEEFLAALVANESGGDSQAKRFEPAVYAHLQALARGARPAFGAIRAPALDAEIADLLHPKALSFHEHFFAPFSAALDPAAIPATDDEALRELATSWGYTQIMGYHLIGRAGTVRDLLEPAFHFHLALALLAEFAAEFGLDLASEFRELFCCWNTGRPDGVTFDPHYVAQGLARMEIYRRMAARAAEQMAAGAQKARA